MARLYGERIMLREYQKEDLPYLREWVNDPVILRYLSDVFLFPHTLDETESFLNGKLENKNLGSKGFVIADNSTGAYLGQIDLVNIDWKNRKAMFGIVLGRKVNFDRGYGSEAIGVLLRFAFREMGLNRIALDVKDSNERGIACYRKCGFREEGRFREDYFQAGKYGDTIRMSILRREWEEREGCEA